MSIGKHVSLFLVDGTPGGLTTAEIVNWTGHVIAGPRSELAGLLKRPEVKRTGVYILLGDDPDGLDRPQAYIGEGDVISTRLATHARPERFGGKDFWNRAVIVTSKDENLTKAHARYLESRLIALATEANRAKLTNGTAPDPIALPEADRSDMEYFILQTKIVLPVLGVNILRSTSSGATFQEASDNAVASSMSPVFELTLLKDGIKASAQEVDGEFTVRAGSTARRSWVGVEAHSYRLLRQKLETDGTLALDDGAERMSFTRDHVFGSPSAAAAVIMGRSANGRNEWKAVGSGTSFGEWQAAGLIDTSIGKASHE